MISKLKTILIILILIYIFICGLLYLFQEKMIFFPEKLDKNFQFQFHQAFEEINIKSNDGKILNGILFKAENPKGLIFYLHGNAGALDSWGDVASTYTDLNYDIFILDYKGYGKSEGEINNEKQFYTDHQIVYDELKKRYTEDKIIVLGYSLGTGFASKIASENHPKLLILQAPYYSLTDIVKKKFPILPSFLLKYKLPTHQHLKNCKMPVIVFHGDQDEILYYGSSLKLEKEFKKGDKLITLHGHAHNGMTENPDYRAELAKILLN